MRECYRIFHVLDLKVTTPPPTVTTHPLILKKKRTYWIQRISSPKFISTQGFVYAQGESKSKALSAIEGHITSFATWWFTQQNNGINNSQL